MNRFLLKLKLSQLIVVSLLVVGLVPLMTLGMFLTWLSEDALETSAMNQLSSAKAIKLKQVENYFSERQGDLNVLANTVHSFHNRASLNLEKDTLSKVQSIRTLMLLLEKELSLFSSSYETVEALKAFSAAFVSGDDVKENTRWHINNDIYGEHVRSFQKTFGWYDVFLISREGDILYSAEQESDLGKNMDDKLIKNTGLMDAFDTARENGITEHGIYFGDFSYYQPSQDFAAFILTPVVRNQDLVGYVALQFPLQRMNEVLGVSGDASGSGSNSYLVGQDKKLRSDTSFLTVSDSHQDNRLIDNKSTQEGLSGISGKGIIRNSQNELVLAQWQPITVFNNRQWVFINEMSIENVVVPVDSTGTTYYSKYINEYSYHDVFLIEPGGEVFYTVTKEADYQTNLLTGRYSNSNLGLLLNKVKRTGRFGLADFAPYEPSQGLPASFIATSILAPSGEPIYYVALQLSLDSINAMMQLREGMGQTGETYLVGQDYRMRSDSYLDQEGHSVAASFAGTVAKNGVKTEASELALSGASDIREIIDYNGNPVLSSFAPLQVGPFQWAVIAEIDSSEAFQAVSSIKQSTVLAIGVSLIVTISLAVYLSHIIRKPLGGEPREMMHLAEQIAGGDLTYRFDKEVQQWQCGTF